MAFEVFSTPPTKLTAGDSYTWGTSLPVYGDGLAYVFSPLDGGDNVEIEGVETNGLMRFSITSLISADLTAGQYQVSRVETDTATSGKSTTACSPLEVNAATIAKSHAQTCIELLEAHIEGRLPQGLESHTINDQSISKITLLDARMLLSKYKAIRRQELAKAGTGGGNTIKMQF